MKGPEPIQPWTQPDIQAMLGILKELEKPGFYPGQHHSKEEVDEAGRKHITYLGIDYPPVIDKFWKLVYDSSCYVEPYEGWEESWPDFYHRAHQTRFFDSASLLEIRRFLVLLTRGERFCDGTVLDAITSGQLGAALRRVRDLAASRD